MNLFLLLYDVFKFVFWKKLKTLKFPFEINWPLDGSWQATPSITTFLRQQSLSASVIFSIPAKSGGVMVPLASDFHRPCEWLLAMRLLCLVSDDDQVQVTQHPTIIICYIFYSGKIWGLLAPLAPDFHRPCKWLPAMRLLCLVSDDDQVQVTQHPTIIKICEARKKCQ